MAKSAKRSGKAKGSTTPSSSSSGTSTPSSQAGPLPPFTKAPGTLQPFFETFSPQEVYLVHIDHSPQDVKKQAFNVPALINVVITVVLAIRVYMVRNMYPAMLATVLGLATPMTVDTASTSSQELAVTVLIRTANVMLDYFLVTIFMSWPIRFIEGPVLWRRNIGFRDREIIIRRSRPSLSEGLERNRWIQKDEATRDKIVAAVTPDRVKKTGYLLVDADWDLDYDAMIQAHELVDRTRTGNGIPLDEFRTAVVVNTDADGWLIWRVGDEDTAEGRARSAQRDQILAFKDKLSAMGKEDLFFRWVELIQYESTRPGGFTPERQKSAMVQAKELFENEGVDFARFWQEIGGLEGFVEELD